MIITFFEPVSLVTKTSLATWSSGKEGRMVIDMVLVENLLASFCCVLGKDTLRQFFLLGGLSK